MDNCMAPNNAGLKNLLKESKLLLPLDRINRIMANAGSDRQVSALKQLRRSRDFLNKVAALERSRPFVSMSNYTCRVLHLDMKYYREFVSALLNFNTNASPTGAPRRSGIAGLLQDIRDVVPQARMRANYRFLLSSDDYLKQGVISLKSPEFLALLRAVRDTREVQDLNAMMLSVGVPMPELKKLFDAALGWNGDEFSGEEFMIILG